MEQALKKIQTDEQSLSLGNKINEYGVILYEINLIQAYPLGDTQIQDWCKCLHKFIPTLKQSTLQKIIDCYVTGKLEWNNKIGIQNIFKAYTLLIDRKIIELNTKIANIYEGNEAIESEIKRLKELKQPFNKINNVIEAIL